MPFCVHRWSIVKRFEHAGVWFAVRRCRRCDKWERMQMDISIESSRLEPIITKEPIVLGTKDLPVTQINNTPTEDKPIT